MRYLIQYHNFEGQGGYPAKEAKSIERLSNLTHSISSRKKHYILNSQNDVIFLIVGIKLRKNESKKYFLWSESPIDRFTKKPDNFGWYDAFSDRQRFLCPPQFINDLEGFDELISKANNFSLGLMDISKWKILDQFKDLSNKHKCKNLDQMTWGQFIENFEKELFKEFGVIRKIK
jgi:hypothetical protein